MGKATDTVDFDPFDTEHIALKDIITYAESVKSSIVRKKIEDIYRNGGNIKKTLKLEGIDTHSGYQAIRNKLERIIGGKSSIRRIIKQFLH